MRWHIAFSIFAAMLAFAACSGRQSTTPQGAGSITPQERTTILLPEVSGHRGSAVIGKNAVDPRELGLPMYPGAITAETGGLLMHSKNGVSRVVSLSTKDDFEKVYQWYKERLPAGSEQAHMAVPNGSVASFLMGKAQDPDNRSVLITQNRNKTGILLTRQTKSNAAVPASSR